MIDDALFVVTLVAALGSGLVAGVFLAFSTFVMKALSRLRPREGLAAMQSINVTVMTPWFMVVFLGTAVVCVLAVVLAVMRWGEPGATYVLGGGLLYLVGAFAVTIAFNVPRNQALASWSANDPDVEELWSGYVVSWTAWNHVRTVAALAGAAFFSVALGS